MTKKPMIHTTGREGWEDSEERYYDGIGSPNQADRMVCQAEEGQVLPAGTTYYSGDDQWLELYAYEERIRKQLANLSKMVDASATRGGR